MVQPSNVPVLLASTLSAPQREVLEQFLRETPTSLLQALSDVGREFRIRVQFSKPVQVRLNNRRSIETADHVFSGFFTHRSYGLCYASRRYDRLNQIRRGWAFGAWESLITSWEPIIGRDPLDEVRLLGKAFHPNAWTNIQAEIKATPEKYADKDLARISVLPKFCSRWDGTIRDWLRSNLENAFANKTEFHHSQSGTKRDFRVETKLCDDGIFRAWFSSYPRGSSQQPESCYILINPTTATMREDD
jgi:hypothetical protein